MNIKLITAVLLAMTGSASAADFTALQGMKASDLATVESASAPLPMAEIAAAERMNAGLKPAVLKISAYSEKELAGKFLNAKELEDLTRQMSFISGLPAKDIPAELLGYLEGISISIQVQLPKGPVGRNIGPAMKAARALQLKVTGINPSVSKEADKAAVAGVQAQNGDFTLYNSQSEALTMSAVCQILEKRKADLGKTTSVRCVAGQNGVMELVASDSKTNKTKSILFNKTDKTVIEYRGSDQVHNYMNNLGQHFFLNLSFVNNGQVLTYDGVLVKGWYRVDFYLRDSAGENRFGYYSGVNY